MSTGDDVTVAQLLAWIGQQQTEALHMAQAETRRAIGLSVGTPEHAEAMNRSDVGFDVARQCSEAEKLIHAFLGVVEHENPAA